MNAPQVETAPMDNITPLPVILPKPRKRAKELPEPFRIVEFTNPRTQSQSWRVTGWKRDRTRVRENYSDEKQAQDRKHTLTTEWLSGHAETEMRATSLSPERCRLAEAGFAMLGDDADKDFLPAIQHWLNHGRALKVSDSVRLDDAFTQFKTWLDDSDCELRDLTKKNLKRRVNVFVNSVPNHVLSDVTPEHITAYLVTRNVSAKSKDNDRRALSSFFGWCVEKKWAAVNPCRKQGRKSRAKGKTSTRPAILSVKECAALLQTAEQMNDGRLVPYVAVCLFGGLRPWEAQRLTWDAVNLKDREISLDGAHTKTGTPRTVQICDTLAAWLERYKGKEFFPSNWRRDFDALKVAIGYGGREWKTEAITDKGKQAAAVREEEHPKKVWPVDVMRHTGCSHYFRKTGSYGQTAEQFGNSEAIIKAHYQGRVSSEDTKKFYSLMPAKKGGRK